MKPALKYQKLTILWALFIFTICSIKLGGVGKSPMFFVGFDKVTHCGLFFVLTVFWCSGIIRKQKVKFLSYTSAAMVVACAVAFGGLIEILQMTIFTWRSGEWGDFEADAIGACMAAFSIVIIERALGHEKN
ncbi:VanZ family protein [Mucilaginibacter sp.]|jgi:VanZ family protein|uniref:VanZ family protein n=1 Tax=Mucilaginibacter sp. TaxID=1882438 RepID=UPI002C6A27E1|nr:VanZ family protein [Mucilaginibacter sp.]HTI57693.1 VanZ family protein [Mucilaginibacter sp.]